ncbi:uncharacterized protein METZ01_LOCUS285986, partial [marine metagenome]
MVQNGGAKALPFFNLSSYQDVERIEMEWND